MCKKIFLFIPVICVMIMGCDPERDDDFSVGPAPQAPQFTVHLLEGDSNRVVIQDLSDGNFQRLWDLPGGTPKTSIQQADTILYTDQGVYTITLFVSKADGSGTASASQQVTIAKDVPAGCSPKMSLLTGGCSVNGKCWIFSHVGGAIKVGPAYGNFSWYTSPVDGLQDAQYDDRYCFTYDDFTFQYDNNGQTVNPWNGYQAENYDPGISEFQFLEGTGADGRDQIILPDDQFMGTWDSDNVLDIESMTETELIIRTRLCGQDGVPAAEGWFEFVFVAQ